MKKLIMFFNLVLMYLILPVTVFGAVTVTNPGDGSGRIYFKTTTNGVILESCDLSPAPSTCNAVVSQDSVNGNILEALAGSGSYFAGWTGNAGSVGACTDSTRTCPLTGSSAGGGNSVNARFNACSFTISPSSASLPGAGATGFTTVTATDTSCNWTAIESLDWISLPAGTSYTGSGTLSYTAAANKSTSARTGVISIGGNDFTITQEGSITKLKVEPDPVNFGTVKVGTTSQLDVKISNLGTTPLNVSSIDIAGTPSNEFSKLKSCAAIAGGSSCTFKVELYPQSSGNKTATLTITSDDPAFPVYQLGLNGTASATAAANLAVSPSAITISNIDLEFNEARAVRMSNSGTGSLIIDTIRINGPNAGEFSVNNDCKIITPGGSCDFIINTNYSSNAPKNATVVISSNAVNAAKVEIPISASTAMCGGSIALSGSSFSSPYEGIVGSATISKTVGSTCFWQPVQRNSWITTSKSGDTAVYVVGANTENTLRMGGINIAGHAYTIIQYGTSSNTTFGDIQGNIFADYINAIFSRSITVGCTPQTSYCPKSLVSRGEMAAFIIRALFGEEFSYTQNRYFGDVPPENVFFKYVQKLKDLGITQLSGNYNVASSVTRGEMAAFLVRALYGESFVLTQNPYFSDVPSSHVFFKYVQKMKDSGVTAVSGSYDVDGIVSREQMAAFISRAFLGME